METQPHPAKATLHPAPCRHRVVLTGLATLLSVFSIPHLVAQTTSASSNLEVLVADFNHDGIPDVLVPSATSPTGTIAFGTIPLGTFSSITKAVTTPAPCIYPSQGSAAYGSVVAADFNGDGFPDLYFSCGTSNSTLSTITGVMLGKGDGTFAPPVLLNAPYANSGVAGDFNKDGKLDLVLVSYPNGYSGTNIQHPALLFFAGNGDGTFAAPVTSSLGTSPTFQPGQFTFSSPVAADVDGDGYPDIILNSAYGYSSTNFNGATLSISVFGNRRDGTFGATSQATRLPDATAAVGTYPASQNLKVLTGNFFGGALPAFAVPDTGTNAGVFLVRNTSTSGSFSLATATKSTYAGLQNVATGTFTGSGFTDLLVSNGTSLNALINDGSGNFGGSGSNPVVYNGLSFPTTNTLFAAADANGDGYSDIYTASLNNSSYLALNVNLLTGTATATSAPATLPLGTAELNASWPGNLNYTGSSANGTQTVIGSPTNVAITGTPNPAPVGTAVTFTAVIAPVAPTGQIPTGSIVFTDGATPLGTVPLDNNGAATLTAPNLSAGAHTIQAAYTGDTFFAASTGLLLQGVTQPGQLTANLLLNPGAELGLVNGAIPYWTPAGQGNPTVDTGTFDGGINPHTGTYDFVGFNGPSDSLSQTVSLLSAGITPAMLDTGTLGAALSFWEQGLNQGTPSDDAFITLTFLNANGGTLTSVTTPEVDSHNSTWQNYANTYTIPTGTRSITYTMNFVRHAGGDLDGFVDDNSLLILAAAPVAATPTLTWTPPAAIPYGTPLSATQLNAVATSATGASIPGTYTYTPAAGTVLHVGINTLSVLFTPTDLTAYTTATTTVSLTVLPAAPTATLSITSGATPVTTVAQGTVVTLTAIVLSSTTPIAPGQINFCDATVCTGIHFLGTAQLTPTGTATLKFIPAAGPHTYNAVFLGTTNYTTAASATSTLNVTALYPTTTTLAQTGNTGNYTLTATVTGSGGPASPTGLVSFANITNANTILATASLATSVTGLSFSNSVNQPTGSNPIGVTPYDLNGDGKKDLVVNNSGSNTLSILLGNGDGTFTAAPALTTGGYPSSVAIGDFNGDGFPDIAVTNFFDSTLTTFLGHGDGTFTLAATVASGTDSRTVATADFNRDGKLDLAVGHDNSVTILLGNGDGTFIAIDTSNPTGNGPNYSIATGDFNNDGDPDIAVTNAYENTVSILLGNGDGTFTAAAKPGIGSTPVSLAVGDLNADGKLDLAVVGQGDNNVTILLGNGDGTFSSVAQSTVGTNPQGVNIGDLNNDGIPDLAVANQDSNTISVLLGKGDGTFTLAASPTTGASPDRAAIADFDGDGIPDLASSNVSAGGAGILLTRLTHTATATAANINPVGTGPQQIIASYSGNTSFRPSASAATTLTGVPLTSIITWSPTAPSTTYGTPLGAQQLNAIALSATGAPIAGTFAYTPAAGTILTVGRQTIQAVFAPTSPLYSTVTTTQIITITQATPTITWSTPAAILPGTALSATQLNASANIPGTFTYTPPAGTVFTTGPQTLSVLFTPTDTLDYTTARATVQLQIGALTLTAITPNTASIGDPNKTITLTGLAFNTGSLAQVNGTRIATTYISPTTLTAVVPAANFTVPATLSITVTNPATPATSAALPLAVTAPAPAITLTGPSTTQPGTQPSLAFAITNPYPVPLTASFNLNFTSAVTPAVDDPSIQFANGGRNFTFTVAANSTAVPAIQLQAGTVAGTVTIPLTLTAAGVNVTPTTLQPVVITIPGAVPNVSTATLTRNAGQLTVTIHGFSNTREVTQAAFHFVAATGATVNTPDITVPVTPIFAGWFSSTPSVVYGSTFTYTQIFNVSDTAANIGSVQVTLTNAVGASTTYTAQ